MDASVIGEVSLPRESWGGCSINPNTNPVDVYVYLTKFPHLEVGARYTGTPLGGGYLTKSFIPLLVYDSHLRVVGVYRRLDLETLVDLVVWAFSVSPE